MLKAPAASLFRAKRMNDGPNGTRRIVHVASGDLWAGAEAQILALASAQREHLGHEVHALLLNEGALAERLRSGGISVTVLPETRLSPSRLLREVRARLAVIRPDVVHTHRQKENLLGALANALSVRATCVRTVHGAPEHGGLRHGLQQRLDRLVGRFLQHGVIAVSETVAEGLRREIGNDRVFVVRNGLSPQELTFQAPSPRHGRPPRIGFVGRLVSVKRVDLLIAAFEELASPGPSQPELHLFGDGPLWNELQARRSASPQADRIHLHGHSDDPARAMRTLDCVVLCSDHEGTPMVMLEAMAMGIPLVVHAVGGMRETLEPARAAVLVARHSAAGYAEGIRQVLEDEDAARELALRARRRFDEAHTSAATAEATWRVYRMVATDT